MKGRRSEVEALLPGVYLREMMRVIYPKDEVVRMEGRKGGGGGQLDGFDIKPRVDCYSKPHPPMVVERILEDLGMVG